MPDPEPTSTEVNPVEPDAPADPGMAAFLAEKKAKEEPATPAEPVVEDPVVEPAPASAEPAASEPAADPKAEPVVPEPAEAPDDSGAQTNQNRLGYQLRQIRAGDPFVAQAKKALQNDYVNVDGISDEQREIRQMKSDRYIEKLETSRATLASDNQQVAEEYSFFRPLNRDGTKNPEFNEPLYKRAIDRFARDSLEMSEPDEKGVAQIVGYKVRLLDYMREEADLYLLGSSGNKDKTPDPKAPVVADPKVDPKAGAKMDAASEEPGGTSTAKAEADNEEKDPMVKAFLAGFDAA